MSGVESLQPRQVRQYWLRVDDWTFESFPVAIQHLRPADITGNRGGGRPDHRAAIIANAARLLALWDDAGAGI